MCSATPATLGELLFYSLKHSWPDNQHVVAVLAAYAIYLYFVAYDYVDTACCVATACCVVAVACVLVIVFIVAVVCVSSTVSDITCRFLFINCYCGWLILRL